MKLFETEEIGCLLVGTTLFVWVLREDRKRKLGQVTSKRSPSFLFNILYGAVALIFIGILMLIIGH